MISSNREQDWNGDLREWIVVLKTVLDAGNKELSRHSIKEIVNIISKISYVYDLWE